MAVISTYSLAELTDITGAKRRSVQLWAEAGVIRAESSTDRAGTGVHRRFSRKEAVIACLVGAFALQQLPIGVLLRVSRLLRDTLKSRKVALLIDAAIEDHAPVYLTLRSSGAPRLIIKLAEGSRDLEISLGFIDAKAAGDQLVNMLGEMVLEKLGRYGSFSITILVNPHVSRLRE